MILACENLNVIIQPNRCCYYSRTSRKRPPKMRRLIGRLRESNCRGVSFEKKSGHIYFKEENLLHAISKLRYVQFHVVSKVLRIF